MKGYNKTYKNILENYGSILQKRRMFFPRNFNLSEEFTKALDKEVKRLKSEDLKNDQIIGKLSKALHFFVK